MAAIHEAVASPIDAVTPVLLPSASPRLAPRTLGRCVVLTSLLNSTFTGPMTSIITQHLPSAIDRVAAGRHVSLDKMLAC